MPASAARLTSFAYSCHDGNCQSDMTPDGLHIRYALWLPGGGSPMFNTRTAALQYAADRGLAVTE